MKFIGQFSNGIGCSFDAPDSMPPRGTVWQKDIEWTRKPSKREVVAIFEEYKAFIMQSYTTISTAWNANLFYVFLLPNKKAEVWAFKPNQQAEAVDFDCPNR